MEIARGKDWRDPRRLARTGSLMVLPASQASQSSAPLVAHTKSASSPSAGAGRPLVQVHHLQVPAMHGLLAGVMGQPPVNTAHSHHTIKTANLRRWHPTDHAARMAHRLARCSFHRDVVARGRSCALGMMIKWDAWG